MSLFTKVSRNEMLSVAVLPIILRCNPNMKGVYRKMYINGDWVVTNQVLEVNNPANGQLVDKVYLVGRKETQNAIAAAKDAFRAWSELTGEERGDYLHKVVEKILEKKEHLAQTITKEMGKTIH